MSFLTVFQSYQGDGRMIMEGYVQYNRLRLERFWSGCVFNMLFHLSVRTNPPAYTRCYINGILYGTHNVDKDLVVQS